jgi:ADP-ribosyl-[dinitrogen reductase] hydrolase
VLFAERDTFPVDSAIASIARGDYRAKDRGAIRGSGYVVDCLEAALWCFLKTDTFEEAVLMAANLGDDADTTAAVCGQVAGAWHGVQGIPSRWLDILARREEIEGFADRLFEAGAGARDAG